MRHGIQKGIPTPLPIPMPLSIVYEHYVIPKFVTTSSLHAWYNGA